MIGHFAKDCRQAKKKPKRRFQASVAEAKEEEPKKKKKTKANKTDEPKREYYLISALTGSSQLAPLLGWWTMVPPGT